MVRVSTGSAVEWAVGWPPAFFLLVSAKIFSREYAYAYTFDPLIHHIQKNYIEVRTVVEKVFLPRISI